MSTADHNLSTSSSVSPSVAVVIISKDEPSLADTLKLLHPQLLLLNAECIVVDASEKRLDYIRLKFPWVNWVDYTRPINLTVTIPHQRNIGVRESSAPIIAFCDSGGAPSDNWLENLIRPILNSTATVTCGPVKSTRESVYKIINDLPDGTVVDTVLTANLAFTRSAFDAVNGFDERYEYGSDADFAWRLINANHPPISIRSAVMGMDWGDWSLQKKRSWRYGKARSRLFRYHPDRRSKILLRSPEVLVYPILILFTLFALPLSVATGWYYILSLPLTSFLVLYLRNIKTGKPLGVLADHVIYSTSFFVEMFLSIFRRILPRKNYVIHMPKDSGPYQPYLISALSKTGVPSDYLPYPTPSKTLNLLLLPLTTLLLSLSGVKVIHIHWLHDFDLSWSKGPLSSKLVALWFNLWLRFVNAFGLSLIWTAHNILPHNKIFQDDAAARRALTRHAAAIIAHSSTSAAEIQSRFAGPTPYVISQGSTPPPTARDSTSSRLRLGWTKDQLTLLILGKVEPYKGILTLLTELQERVNAGAPNPLSGARLLIAGSCSNLELKNKITTAVENLSTLGLNVEFNERALTDSEFWDHLHAADIALFPFDSITNSGSLVAALSAGTPSIVTDLPAFNEINTPAVLKAGPAISSFLDSLLTLSSSSGQHKEYLSAQALLWASTRTWDQTALSTRQVYEQVSIRKASS